MRSGLLNLIAAAMALQLAFAMWQYSRVAPAPAPVPAPQVAQETQASVPRRPESNAPKAGNAKLGNAMIRGAIFDEAAAPVAGALVVAERRSLDQAARVLPPSQRWTTFTDAEGRFVFGTLPDGAFSVEAESGESRTRGRAEVRQDAAAAELLMTLQPAGTLQGAVVLADGAPAAGAMVYPVYASALGDRSAPYRYQAATTGEDGRFELSGLPAVPWRVLVVAGGHAPALSEETLTPEVQLHPGRTLRGIVRQADGVPASGIKVTAVEAAFAMEQASATTGRDGRFTLPNLRAARFRIDLDSDAIALLSGPVEFDLAADVETAEVELRAARAGRVRGRVVRAGGEGVRGVTVRALREDGSVAREVRTDSSGGYRFNGLPPAAFTVLVMPIDSLVPGQGNLTRIAIVSGRLINGPEITLSEGMGIEGSVVGASGRPVPEANVFIEVEPSRGAPVSFRTGTDGAFAARGFGGAEIVRIWAEYLGRRSPVFGPIDLGPNGLRGVTLALPG